MYGSVHGVLTANQTLWQTIPAFVSAVEELEAGLSELDAKFSEQTIVTKGVSKERSEKLIKLIKRMKLAHNALYLYAKETGDLLLQERNQVSVSSINHLSIGKVKVHATSLKNDLDAHTTDLSAFGLTTAFINDLLTDLETLPALVTSTREAILIRKAATQEITSLERSISKLFREELDRLIEFFESSNPKFVQAYRNARTVVDAPHNSVKPPQPDDGAEVDV